MPRDAGAPPWIAGSGRHPAFNNLSVGFVVMKGSGGNLVGGVIPPFTSGHEQVRSVAVDPSTGDLYVVIGPGDPLNPNVPPAGPRRVIKLNPQGERIPGCEATIDAAVDPVAAVAFPNGFVVVGNGQDPTTSDARVATELFNASCQTRGVDLFAFESAPNTPEPSRPVTAFGADADSLGVAGRVNKIATPQTSGMWKLTVVDVDQPSGSVTQDWAITDPNITSANAAGAVKVSGQEDRFAAAGPPGTVRLYNMDDGAPASDPESTPVSQYLIQQPGGGIYTGGEAILPPSPPQPPQTALAVARFNNVPPLQASGFFVHDPFAGDHLQFRGLVVGPSTQSIGWTGLGTPGQETANLTESPASGAGTPITTTPLVAANMPIIGEAGSGSQQPPPTGQQPPPTGQQPPPGGSFDPGLPPLGEADLHATARLLRSGLDLVELAQGGPDVGLPIGFTVTNFGPDPAVSVRAAPVGISPSFLQLLDDDTCPGPGDLRLLENTAALCERLTVNDSFQVGAMYVVPGPGTYLATIAADALGPPDPGPRPNEGSVEIEVEQLPDSKGLKVTTPSRLVIARARGASITGKATGARTVYVAIARREQGARVRTSAAGCAWLANTRGTVRRERGRLCNEPIWLKARGTKSWRLNLSRRLPPGQYTVLSRAVEKSGVTEAAFSRRDGNRLDVRIRRR